MIRMSNERKTDNEEKKNFTEICAISRKIEEGTSKGELMKKIMTQGKKYCERLRVLEKWRRWLKEKLINEKENVTKKMGWKEDADVMKE